MKTLVFRIFFILALGLNLSVVAAPAPPVGGGSPSCWPPPCVPIDGGIGFLIAAGALYGLKRLSSNKKEYAE